MWAVLFLSVSPWYAVLLSSGTLSKNCSQHWMLWLVSHESYVLLDNVGCREGEPRVLWQGTQKDYFEWRVTLSSIMLVWCSLQFIFLKYGLILDLFVCLFSLGEVNDLRNFLMQLEQINRRPFLFSSPIPPVLSTVQWLKEILVFNRGRWNNMLLAVGCWHP